MKMIRKFYSRYKEYLRIDLAMYFVMILLIILYFAWSLA